MSVELPTLNNLAKVGSVKAAAFWLERLQDEDGYEDDDLFRAWLATSDENRDAWAHALELWDCFDEAEPEGELEQIRQEALAFRPRRTAASWVRYAIAAAVLGIVGTTAFLTSEGGDKSVTPSPQIAQEARPDPRAFGALDYVTKVGEQRTVTLEDGSKLTLDTASAIDVAYVGQSRLVRLVRGQVYFDVTHDTERPFRVAAGERIVTVLGTRFNVRLAPGQTSIYLEKGSIGVSPGSDPAHPMSETFRLVPGQMLIAQAGKADQVSTVQGQSGIEWRQGFVQFDGQTLGQAIVEVNRYTTRQMVLRDPNVAALRVSGAFPTNNIESFVQTLSALYPVRVVPMADGKLEIVAER
ncbi:FecR family protein [Novosphingobium sp. AP12]|uniref:FecR family protein n=1 Tax=Novosphingobium sp. AP12 TaxID=1144305 RepID=UPI000271E21D|nr:FecR family protein [Novosphingobium sp. AP12]EJL33402.1 Fe2+-dicitrate sensor, membrane component [Novosphingobium sp. AP12]